MKLLTERFSINSKIGELKSNQEINIFETDYQHQIIDKLSEEYFGALDREQIKSIFNPIFQISDKAQKRK